MDRNVRFAFQRADLEAPGPHPDVGYEFAGGLDQHDIDILVGQHARDGHAADLLKSGLFFY